MYVHTYNHLTYNGHGLSHSEYGPCFMPYTLLLNFHSLIFPLMPFVGCILMLTLTYSMIYNRYNSFHLYLFIYTNFFRDTTRA